MTDFEKTKALFDELGIQYDVCLQCYKLKEYKAIALLVDNEKVVGYNGFASHYLFDDDGKFYSVCIWE